MAPRPPFEIVEVPGVDDTIGANSAFERAVAAVFEPLELARRMGVGVDGKGAPHLGGQTKDPVRRVESFGRELISMALPCRTQARSTCSASNVDSGRPRPTKMRPVRCPTMSRCGFSMARMSLAVMSSAGIRNLEWALPMTTSSRARRSGS